MITKITSFASKKASKQLPKTEKVYRIQKYFKLLYDVNQFWVKISKVLKKKTCH